MKDLLAHAKGRDDSLADSESYSQVRKKIGTGTSFHWFIDVSQVFKLVGQVAAAKGGGGANLEAQLQLLGFNGLKAIGGGTALNTGEFDLLSKIFVLSPGPAQGILKLFPMPKVNLKPEPWVPATVATYEVLSWDLDSAYTGLKDLLAMFGARNALDDFEGKIAGPEGDKFSFEKDLIGPLGDRITLLSEFKKPINEKSQRMLFAVALEDPKAFQTTFTKLIVKVGQQPKKRDFQGTTIYDFEATLPNIPVLPAKGPRASSAWPSPRSISSSPPIRPSWNRSSAAARLLWPIVPPTSRSCAKCPRKPAWSSSTAPRNKHASSMTWLRTANFKKPSKTPDAAATLPRSISMKSPPNCPSSPSSPSTSANRGLTPPWTTTASP